LKTAQNAFGIWERSLSHLFIFSSAEPWYAYHMLYLLKYCKTAISVMFVLPKHPVWWRLLFVSVSNWTYLLTHTYPSSVLLKLSHVDHCCTIALRFKRATHNLWEESCGNQTALSQPFDSPGSITYQTIGHYCIVFSFFLIWINYKIHLFTWRMLYKFLCLMVRRYIRTTCYWAEVCLVRRGLSQNLPTHCKDNVLWLFNWIARVKKAV
jgi:hypothetical protein